MSVRIIIDSGSDILLEDAKKRNLDFLPIKIYFDDKEYRDGIDLSHSEFYEKLIESDVLPKTSQIAPYEYEEVFEDVKRNGDTAVCITLSSKLSGCNQSAHIAQLEGYEDCVYIVDSKNVCIGERILIEHAINLRDQGKSAKEIADELESLVDKVKVIALLDTLEYLKKGGRISSAVAFAGSVLSIKPVVTVEDGVVAILGKARGSKNGNNMLIESVNKCGGINYNMPYCLAYTGLSDTLLKKYISDSSSLYDCAPCELPIYTIGSSIGTHVGPGAIALAFFSK